MASKDRPAKPKRGTQSDDEEASMKDTGAANLLDSRIREGLRKLYAGVVDEPLPTKISDLLDKMRAEEEGSARPKRSTAGGDSVDE